MRSLFARARSLWGGLRRPGRLEAEMDEEMRFHIGMEAERLVRERGVDPAEARRRAAAAFGGVERYKEEGRDARGINRVTGVGLDLKLGVRMLGKYPGLTVVALLALSIAIGGGAGYLELINDVYDPALPLKDGGRVVGIYNQDVRKGGSDERALHDFVAWREGLVSVEELGAYQKLERNLITADGRSEPVQGVEITASAFRLAGVPPLLGRPLVDGDDRPGAPPVVVIGHDLWKARFGGDPAVVGRAVRLGSASHTIVGVMPRGFGFPVNHGLWVPLRANAADYRPGEGPAIRVFGRLAPGVSIDKAQAELASMGLRAAADDPATHGHLRPRIRPYVPSLFQSEPDGETGMTVLYSINLFFLGLLGVCGANVATLVFARTATREGEITVRTALGASRARIVSQLFAEALVLSSLAAALGLAGAAAGLRWIKATFITSRGGVPPFWWNDRLSAETLLYAGVLAVLVAGIVGIVPALKATGPAVQARLKHAAARGSGMKFGGLWTGVVVAQVALTVVFLLVVVSVGWNVNARMLSARASFPAGEYLSARLEMDRGDPPSARKEAAEAELQARFGATFRELERRLAAEPGVAGTTFASALPGMAHPWLSIDVDGVPAPPGFGGAHGVRTASVDAAFFAAFGAPMVSGRGFAPEDVGRPVAIVDQTFVREVMGGRDPVGLRVRHRDVESQDALPGPWLEIVGVSRDLTTRADKRAGDAVLYRPAAPGEARPLHLAVRVKGDAGALAPRLRAVAAGVDPGLRLHDITPLDEVDRESQLGVAFLVRLLGVVGAIALLLSTAGVYALMSFTVARRTREIGIRSALGAAPRRVVTGILSRAMAQVGLGVVAGCIPGSLIVAYGLPEVARGAGPVAAAGAFVAVAAFMTGVGVLASAIPVRRALRIQPTEALRADG